MGKFRQVDFSQRPGAASDIFDVDDWYQSYLQSEQWAPDHATIEKKVKALLSAIEALQSAVRAFECFGEPGKSRLEFNEAISDLLRDNGLARADMKDLFEEVSFPLDRLGSFLRVIRTELSERLRTDELHVSSSAEIRAEYFRKLHRVLVHHNLSDGVGQNSLIVQLVLRLDGADSRDAGTDEVRRKQLASDLKRAVNPPKGA